MYLRYFYCIGNRYSVFYVNYIISQLTVMTSFFAHFLLRFNQLTNPIPQDSQKLTFNYGNLMRGKADKVLFFVDALKSTIHTASVNLEANSRYCLHTKRY